MKRNINNLKDTTFDVLVIGAGIHGATTAYYAAKAGFKTAAIDKNDFGSATSANSLKILHGGLRYLQHLNFKRMRQSILSRRSMMRIAPTLISPLPCLMPTYGYGLRSREILHAALVLNDLISFDRNCGLPPEINLKKGYTIPKDECLKITPTIPENNLRGASIWHDAIVVNTERLILEYILQGNNLGALAANYVQATGFRKLQNGNFNVEVKDLLSNQRFCIQTKTIINASGPWVDELSSTRAEGNKKKQKWALALNLITDKNFFGEYAVGLEGASSFKDKDAVFKRDKRLFFFVPWKNHTMIGTNYTPYTGDTPEFKVTTDAIEEMITEVNRIFPPAALTYKDITFYHAGLLPMKECSSDDNVQLEKNSKLIEHTNKELLGLISIKGVKYTTAPSIAQSLVNRLKKKYNPTLRLRPNKNVSPSITSKRTIESDAITPSPEHIKHFIRNEMAIKLSDIIFRRTDIGTAHCPPIDLLREISTFMAKELGWNKERVLQELNEVLARYQPLDV